MRTRFRVTPDVAWQSIGDEAILIHLTRGVAMGLNPVASLVWSLLETSTREEIESEVVKAFDVDDSTARHDVNEFLHECRRASLITEHDAGAGSA